MLAVTLAIQGALHAVISSGEGVNPRGSSGVRLGRMRSLEVLKNYFLIFYLFFFGGGGEEEGWKIRVKELIITQKPHHSFVIVWFDSGFLGFKLSWSFPTWKREKRDHLSTLWQKILQREQLNPWTTESTLPQTETSPSLSWNHGPKH